MSANRSRRRVHRDYGASGVDEGSIGTDIGTCTGTGFESGIGLEAGEEEEPPFFTMALVVSGPEGEITATASRDGAGPGVGAEAEADAEVDIVVNTSGVVPKTDLTLAEEEEGGGDAPLDLLFGFGGLRGGALNLLFGFGFGGGLGGRDRTRSRSRSAAAYRGGGERGGGERAVTGAGILALGLRLGSESDA